MNAHIYSEMSRLKSAAHSVEANLINANTAEQGILALAELETLGDAAKRLQDDPAPYVANSEEVLHERT